MQRSTGRILTTHAGSLPRPTPLTALLIERAEGRPVDETAIDEAVEHATAQVIARQIDAGIDIVNNGEIGRESFFTYVQHRMSGFGGHSSRPMMADLIEYPTFLERMRRERALVDRVSLMDAPKAVAAVRYLGDDPIRSECDQLSRLLAAHAGSYIDSFVSAPSPGIVAAAMTNEHYPDLETYIAALAEALRGEYGAIVEAGHVLQIDAPDLALERHTLFHSRPLAEFRSFVGTVVAAINHATAGLDPDRIRLHVCWGNYEGPHDLDVPLADIWDIIREARVGGFLLSMANPRHAHEWRVLNDGGLPADTVVVPGVIDTTTNYVEHPRAVADAIIRVAEAVGDPERVLAGTDCGFETSAGFAAVAPDVVWVKLRSLSDGAAIASRELHG
jgi:5-methyltetrahydropteroyltriglutamate--homocysteine methyltransferase